MSTTEETIDAIRDAINVDIEHHSNLAEEAFATLEKMNISPEEYKKANWQFGLNHYVVSYLRKVKEFTIVSGESLKTIERRMRFHAHQQRTKGELGDQQEISVAQATVAVILEGYINRFFDTES